MGLKNTLKGLVLFAELAVRLKVVMVRNGQASVGILMLPGHLQLLDLLKQFNQRHCVWCLASNFDAWDKA